VRAGVVIVVAIVALAAAAAPLAAKAKGKSTKPRKPRDDWTSTAVWSARTTPKAGAPRSIGGYASGCLRGGVALPPVGPGFEVLHLGRHRFFGHPKLVEFVRRLAAHATEKDLPPLLIGDLGQARGGPTPSDHGSHQSGLDVDVSYVRPPDAAREPLTVAARESMRFPPVVDLEKQTVNDLWNDRIVELLSLAASDPAVDRIFVNPVVKREACVRAPGAPWLRRLRPWWGHHDHFHVRLACPAGSPTCRAQPPVPEGDGCEEMDWWFGASAKRALAERAAKPSGGPPRPRLPPECREILR